VVALAVAVAALAGRFDPLLAEPSDSAQTASTATLVFGSQAVGTVSGVRLFTYEIAGKSPVSVTSTSTTGDFQVTGLCPNGGLNLPPKSKCNFNLTFAPSAAGTRKGSLTIATNTGQRVIAHLTGMGVAPKLNNLGARSAAPFDVLSISATRLSPSAAISVDFAAAGSPPIQVPALQADSSTVSVSVPPFITPKTGTAGAGKFNVRLVETLPGGGSVLSNAAVLKVGALPALPAGVAPGSLTLAYLQALAQVNSQFQGQISSAQEPQISDALAGQATSINDLIALLQPVQDGSEASVTLGTVSGTPVTVTSQNLAASDQMLIAVLSSLANASPMLLTESGGLWPYLGPSMAFAQSAGCMSAEASSALQNTGNASLFSAGIAQAFSAPASSTNCQVAQAADTAAGVVLGAGGVAIALLALAGAPAYALALPAAALIALGLELGGGLILVGGTQQPTDPGAKAIVETGLEQLNGAFQGLFKRVFPEIENLSTALNLKDLFDGTNQILDAFGATAPAPPTPPVFPPPPPPAPPAPPAPPSPTPTPQATPTSKSTPGQVTPGTYVISCSASATCCTQEGCQTVNVPVSSTDIQVPGGTSTSAFESQLCSSIASVGLAVGCNDGCSAQAGNNSFSFGVSCTTTGCTGSVSCTAALQ